MYLVLKIAGGLCLLYYLVIVLYAGITASFAWFWAVMGAILIVAALLGEKLSGDPGAGRVLFWGRLVFWGGLGVLLLTMMFLFGKIASGMRGTAREDLSYVVVLGAQVRGDTPSRSLKARLDHAAKVAEAYPEVKLILSGGQGPGETISEAECMRVYLEENYQIDPERLIMEDRSTSTLENLRFSDELTGCGRENTGILSNDFHVYRAVAIAKKMGYTAPSGIAAPSDPVMQVHFCLREIFALLNEMRRHSV